MTKKIEPIEIVIILDRSGSMAATWTDAIGGMNAFLTEQKQNDSPANVTIALFNDSCWIMNDGVDLKTVDLINHRSYHPAGSTALFDAIVSTVNKVSDRISGGKKSKKKQNVIVIIITDGEENASKSQSLLSTRTVIDSMKERGWEFRFFGANIDTIKVGSAFGLQSAYCTTFNQTPDGYAAAFRGISDNVINYRTGR